MKSIRDFEILKSEKKGFASLRFPSLPEHFALLNKMVEFRLKKLVAYYRVSDYKDVGYRLHYDTHFISLGLDKSEAQFEY